MSEHRTIAGPPPERLHWIQVKLAFGNEGREPARPATLADLHGESLRIRYRDGTEETVEVVEPERLQALLDTEEVCMLDGEPLLLVNTSYRVLGVATGPLTPPAQLRVSLAFAFENESVTRMLPAGDGQPTIHTLALRSSRRLDTSQVDAATET